MNVTPENAKVILPQAIQKELSRLGWSRYRLAKASGITQTTMKNVCNGTHEPKASVLKTIADTLGVSADKLLTAPREKSEKMMAASA